MNETDAVSVAVNGEQVTVPSGATIASLVEARGLSPQQVAVELNREIVPRKQHAETVLSAGDRVEIVTMVGGG